MSELSTVELVFRDLEDALDELLAESISPKQVRRNFVRFLDLTQKLTASMRKEYREKTGETWSASTFTGWNGVTELFKELRNVDQHEYPVFIQVHDREYYSFYADRPGIMIEGTWSLSLEGQLADKPPEGMELRLADPETGEPSQTILPAKTEYEFRLYPRTKKVEDLLTRISDSDVRSLSEKCFGVLLDYYRHYQSQVTQHGES
jgi:hypothetical protein